MIASHIFSFCLIVDLHLSVSFREVGLVLLGLYSWNFPWWPHVLCDTHQTPFKNQLISMITVEFGNVFDILKQTSSYRDVSD